jgi:ribonuclease D
MCLRRDYGWTFANLFDTMWAARVLGWPRTGLGNILQERFGIRLNKRMQRHDWGRRPLSSEAQSYARLDTHYLLPLREQMLDELKQRGRLEQAREFFAKVAQTEPHFRSFDPDNDLWRVKGVWDLEPEERAILRELLIWRDTEARRQNRPSFKIVNDQTLVALAQTRPQSPKRLEGINGFKSYHQRRYGRKILNAIAQGVNASVPQPPPRPPRPSDETLERYEALRSWRKDTASQSGVDPDVIISNSTLWTLAQHAPRSRKQLADLGALSPWKKKTFGEALLSILGAND